MRKLHLKIPDGFSAFDGPPLPLSDDLVLAHPWWLLALALIPIAFWFRRQRRVSVLLVPFAAAWHRPSLATGGRWAVALALMGFVLFVGALARPQKIRDKRETKAQGYDIVLSIDLSGSMMYEDFEIDGQPVNRLEAIRPIIKAFINDRPNDRIGIVVFAGRAYTLAPLTFDHGWLIKQVERLKLHMIQDGTAIGDGLGVALTRLEQAERKENTIRKGAFVVLLTDGANNQGVLTPMQSTEIAKSRGIPIYTIGAGRNGFVRMPVHDSRTGKRVGSRTVPSELDEGTLRAMAEATGGKFFVAGDTRTVESAFAAIDKAQKIEFEAKSHLITSELFYWPAGAGLGLFLLGAVFARRKSSVRTRAIAPPHPATA